MLPLIDLSRVKRVLCLGAHCDDIEIGAGGTILRLIEAQPLLQVRWVVFGGEDPTRVTEARLSAGHFLAGAGRREIAIFGYPDGFLPFQGDQIKDTFDELKSSFAPDLIFSHHDDRHQDHRLVSELTWSTWCDQVIFEYDVIGECDGHRMRPNFFVPLSQDVCHNKVKRLLEAYPSQAGLHWFKEDVFWSLLRLRGVECNAPSGLAEAFFVRKLVA